MNNKGITYFRLNSPYEGDITKNCALDGYEVDNNFLVLEGRDIKSVYVEGDKIKIGLLNGDVISSDAVFDDFTKDLTFRFDAEKGILYITRNGVETRITGFVTEFSDEKSVASDNTLYGNGKPSDPLSLSHSYRTGKYEPVIKFIDKTQGENLPSGKTNHVGDRYIVLDTVSDYGFLYDYDSVRRIACSLADNNSGWRIPTKEDWDDMLNAIEPCEEDKEHASASCNRYLGRYAGKLIKAVNGWRIEGCSNAADNNTCIDYDTTGCGCTCGKSIECSPMYCGEYGSCCCKPKDNSNAGVDKYGFKALPAGYADDGGNVGYFGERAYFWTATNSKCGNSAFMKRLEYNKSSVYQDVISSKNALSLRLVKTYDGANYLEKEEILGVDVPTILMPSVKNGHAIWTEVNVAFADKIYHPIMPNMGMNVPVSKHYYTYEWDGNKWEIHALKEGESVVILNSPNEQYGYEYQIVKGDLINLSERVTDTVYDSVKQSLTALDEKIEAESERAILKETELDEKIGEISAKLDDEIANRSESEELIDNKINDEKEARETEDKAIRQDLSTLNDNVAQSINDINKNVEDGFNTINQNVADGFSNINQAISDEIKARTDKDTELQNQIDTLTTDETGISNKLAEEIAAREAKDTELEGLINANKTDVDNALDAEKTARENKDTEIEGKLIDSDGTGFDVTTGIITLKSKDGSNDIKIQLILNMGTI